MHRAQLKTAGAKSIRDLFPAARYPAEQRLAQQSGTPTQSERLMCGSGFLDFEQSGINIGLPATV